MRRRQDLRRSAVFRCQGQGRATVYRKIEREHTHRCRSGGRLLRHRGAEVDRQRWHAPAAHWRRAGGRRKLPADADWPCQPQLAPLFSASCYVAPHSVARGLEFSFDLAPRLRGGLEAGGGIGVAAFGAGPRLPVGQV